LEWRRGGRGRGIPRQEDRLKQIVKEGERKLSEGASAPALSLRTGNVQTGPLPRGQSLEKLRKVDWVLELSKRGRKKE